MSKTVLMVLSLICVAGFCGVATGQSRTFESGESKTMRVFALRLKPGQDLRKEIEAFVKDNKITVGFVVTKVGSLRTASIRFADQSSSTKIEGKFEIVSLVGSLSTNGSHLHISISDKDGKTIGGHLSEGSIIYTTAEIIIAEAESFTFTRERDEETTYQELRINKRKHN